MEERVWTGGILCLILLLGVVDAVPVLAYHPPTELEDTIIDANDTQINISIVGASGLDKFRFNLSGQKNISSVLYGPDLVLALNFNNNSAIGESGSHLTDISEYGNNGSIYSDINYISDGRFNGGLDFAGSGGDYVICGNDSSLNLAQEITISLWMRPDVLDGYLISKNLNNANDNQYAMYIGGVGDLVTYYPSSALKSAAGSLAVGVWTNIILTRDSGGDGQFYIDGKASGSSAPIAMASSPSYHLRLGCRWNQGTTSHLHYNGRMDELRVYSRALTEDEIWMHYQSEFMRYNSSEYRFYCNLTNLTDGSYEHFGWANDSAGDNGTSGVRTLTLTSAGVSGCGTIVSDMALAQNLVSNGSCIVIRADDIRFDCGVYSLTGNGSGEGINVTSHSGVTIVNCSPANYSQGILLRDTSGVLLANTTCMDFYAYNSTVVEVDLPYTDCEYAFLNARRSEDDEAECRFNLTTPCCRMVHVESYEAEGITTHIIVAWGAGGLGLLLLIWRLHTRRRR